jgi:hypothetical protein
MIDSRNLNTLQIKAFLPSKDFEHSMRFYQDLGFTIEWSSDDLAQLRAGHCSFLLTKFYQKEYAENFMMHLLVEDVDAWWGHVISSRLTERYGVRANEPEDRPWGIRDFTINDPSSVLWRIGQDITTTQ